MNVDAAIRYMPIVREIKKIGGVEAILEVGSGTNGITDFIDVPTIGLDNDFAKTKTDKNPLITHKKASILNIPFPNGEFAVVVCLDTFEHLPADERADALAELIRVTRKNGRIYLGYPAGSLSVRAEKFINCSFKKIHRRDHPWLIEHRRIGLPDKNDVFGWIAEKKIGVKIISSSSNANLLIWVLVHWLFTVHGGKKIGRLASPLKRLLCFLGTLKIKPGYRVMFTIQK